MKMDLKRFAQMWLVVFILCFSACTIALIKDDSSSKKCKVIDGEIWCLKKK